MALDAGEVVLWATVFGLLVGIIWSLKYIVVIDRRIENIERVILRKSGGAKRTARRRRR